MTAAKIFLNCRNPVAICPLLNFSALAVDYDPVRLAQITVLAYGCYRRVKRRCSPTALPVHEPVVICGAIRIDIIAETFCRIIDNVVCVVFPAVFIVFPGTGKQFPCLIVHALDSVNAVVFNDISFQIIAPVGQVMMYCVDCILK